MKLQFLGAAKEVTGSKHLITLDNGFTILLDCGMYQGKGLATDSLNRQLGFDPASIDALVLSHAHIDHSGLIPYIYKLGFKGRIYCTSATRDLCAIMLQDSAYIQESDIRDFNRKRIRQGLSTVEPIYTIQDALNVLNRFFPLPTDEDVKIAPGVTLRFTDNGHLLGSATSNLTIRENGKIKRLCYTGDIGRYQNRILVQPKPFPQADYIITESTYGDRIHKGMEYAEDDLYKVLMKTCVEQKGKLIIPSFAIGRTQELLYSFDKLNTEGKLPKIEVFVDSPLAVSATNIFKLHPECYSRELSEYLKIDDTPFAFDKLHYITHKEDSMALNEYDSPCVIISASGMMEAGRIKHHVAHNISDAKNTILGVGYCAPKTLGARIFSGAEKVSIYGVEYLVKAQVERIEAYSAHGDYLEMMRYLNCQKKSKVKNLFLVHGDFDSQKAYKENLKDSGFPVVTIPNKGETVYL